MSTNVIDLATSSPELIDLSTIETPKYDIRSFFSSAPSTASVNRSNVQSLLNSEELSEIIALQLHPVLIDRAKRKLEDQRLLKNARAKEKRDKQRENAAPIFFRSAILCSTNPTKLVCATLSAMNCTVSLTPFVRSFPIK